MKKGFTLIELLAVIVILSVIAIISVPMVSGIIESARKNSFKITCYSVYDAYDQYNITDGDGKENSCEIFDFGSNRNEMEVIDNVKYIPVSKLNLKGELPKKGTYKVCNGIRELTINDGKYTCYKDPDKLIITEGDIDTDTENPVINDIILSSTSNSIKVYVDATNKNGTITKYYYKLNGEETVSESNSIILSGLNRDTEYEVEVVAENRKGLKSNIVSKKITTKNISNPIITQTSKTPSNFSWSTSKIIQINYNNINIEDLKYYFKSTGTATVSQGVVTESCGTGTLPENCEVSSDTTLKENVWYKTTSTTPSIIYKANAILYAFATDGNNVSATSTYTIDKMSTGTPTVPVITGGSSLWATSRTITLSKESTETSGILKYQYYISNDMNSQTGGSWIDGNSAIVIKDGTYYVFMRAIANNGNISDVSSPQLANIDRQEPIINVNINGKSVSLTFSDNRGISGYAVTTSLDNSTWVSTSDTTATWVAQQPGTYYAMAKDVAGNTSYTVFTINSSEFSYSAILANTSYDATINETSHDATSSNKRSCKSCSIVTLGKKGECCTNNCTVQVTNGDSNYHIGYCSDGHSLENSVCGYGVTIGQTVEYDCTTTKVYSCPSGETLNGTKCIKQEYTCPNGGTLSGTKCVKQEYTCPNGGTLNSSNNMCEF